MIAASEPQEFIPSGRHHLARHPGRLNLSPTNVQVAPEAFLLHRLQKVKISGPDTAERWFVREAPVPAEELHLMNDFTKEPDTKQPEVNSRQSLENAEENYNKPEIRSRFSDIAISKHPSPMKTRYASDPELHRIETPISTRIEPKLYDSLKTHHIEEELYIKGNTVTWTRGLISTPDSVHNSGDSRITLCTYTLDNPIIHALWCTFFSTRPKLDLSELNIKSTPTTETPKSFRSICVIDSTTLRVFSEKGEDYFTNLQEPVTNVWASNFGLILEKEYCESSVAAIYSLSHPLDEICPIAIRQSGGIVQLANDPTLQIVFVNDDPSLCMIFDKKSGLHSIYLVRAIRPGEYQDVTNCTSTSISNQSSISIKKPFGTFYPLATGSPYCNRSNMISPQPARCLSPMASISRCQSPVVSPLLSNNIWGNRSTRLQLTPNSVDNFFDTSSKFEASTCVMPKRVAPELCLEHVWTENQRSVKDGYQYLGAATKVFLSSDFVGQTHFCFLVPSRNSISIARMEIMNNMQLIIGVVKSFKAKDAIAIPYLNMMAVLENDGQVVLRSGLMTIGKLHVGGVNVGLSGSPYFASNAAGTVLSSPFPRRSSLLHTNTKAPEVRFNDSVQALSPVPVVSSHNYTATSPVSSSQDGGICLVNLRDCVFDRITFQYSDNTCYRFRLPNLTDCLTIKTCLSALKQALPRDLAMQIFSKWYSTRNCPGRTDFNMEEEWNIFTKMILELLGYDLDLLVWGPKLKLQSSTTPTPKRKKAANKGSNDWIELLNSKTNAAYSAGLSRLLNYQNRDDLTQTKTNNPVGRINTEAVLFPQFPLVFYTLHLIYEELKLNLLRSNELPLLATLLHLLSRDLRLREYVVHYWTDFPQNCSLNFTEKSQIRDADLAKMNQIPFLDAQPANIMSHLFKMMCGTDLNPYPFINFVNPQSKDIIRICSMILAHRKGLSIEPQIESLIRVVVPPGSRFTKKESLKDCGTMSLQCNLVQNAVVFMAERGFTRRRIENLPAGINLLLHEAIWQCRETPQPMWPVSIYQLLERMDLATQNESFQNKENAALANDEKLHLYSEPGQEDLRCPYFFTANTTIETEDGMENMDLKILKLRFPNDHRVGEIRRLLQSATPVPIKVVQRPEVTDHDYIEEQEKHLFAVCTRTMALPVGRGMFTLRTHTPIITETLPIPRLCLSGKAPPRGNAVELSHIDTPPNMNLWPLFHNGVAAGLKISPNATNIDSTWITFNKPKSAQDIPAEHAGFLMALGLNGHLKNLAILYTYEYLIKINELTSIGLLLGLAATQRGTMHTATTKMLSIHVEALLPPTSMELDVPQNIQISALLGIGLVYEASSHRHITEVLLAEIGRPPGPEMENSIDRESYSLAAGLALGLVTLGQGGKPTGLADLAVSDTLHYYMAGGIKRPLTGAQKDKYKVPSFQIREGSCVNLDITAPGATLALGLMYLGSGSKAIAEWMRPPDTQYLLDFVRPDLLLLRIVSRALILWDDIEPTSEWVDSQVPVAIRPFCLVKPGPEMDVNIDFEAMNQAYCNIIAGACFALGLRYAGSANEDAFKVLHDYCRMFVFLTAKSIAELAGKPTIESCLNLILLSLSMVMAGTGDLSVLRIVRHLRRRVNPASSATVTYGSHLAMHMALGLLFLGGGRLTLSSSPPAVAAMLCAFFPKFPTHSNDNRYHLQAFRHLYVLAVQPRLIIPRDIIQGTACYTKVTVTALNGETKTIKAPCMLPELSMIQKLVVNDERYWPIVFEKDRNWDQLLKILEDSGYLFVKKRAGCLSYIQDPSGTKSLVPRPMSEVSRWNIQEKEINAFGADPIVKNCISQFLTPVLNHNQNVTYVEQDDELLTKQRFSMLAYECVTKDKVAILPTLMSIIKEMENVRHFSNTVNIWDLKLVCAQVLNEPSGKSLISQEFAQSINQQVRAVMDSWQSELKDNLKRFIKGDKLTDNSNQINLAKFITHYNIPYNLETSKFRNPIDLLIKISKYHLPSYTSYKLIEIMK